MKSSAVIHLLELIGWLCNFLNRRRCRSNSRFYPHSKGSEFLLSCFSLFFLLPVKTCERSVTLTGLDTASTKHGCTVTQLLQEPEECFFLVQARPAQNEISLNGAFRDPPEQLFWQRNLPAAALLTKRARLTLLDLNVCSAVTTPAVCLRSLCFFAHLTASLHFTSLQSWNNWLNAHPSAEHPDSQTHINTSVSSRRSAAPEVVLNRNWLHFTSVCRRGVDSRHVSWTPSKQQSRDFGVSSRLWHLQT